MSGITVQVFDEPAIGVTVESDCDIVLTIPQEVINVTIEEESTIVQIISDEPAVTVEVQNTGETIVVEQDIPATVIEVAPVSGGTGVAETFILEAGETLSSGNYVNIYQDGPTTKVRKADASLGRQADGYVKGVVTMGQPATVFIGGMNDQLFSLVPSQRYFLGVLGNVTNSPPVYPVAAIHQFLGVAISSTTLKNEIEDLIQL